jgi:L-2,4-diaminobutyrate decarboxylase
MHKQTLETMFSPEAFNTNGRALIEILSRYLSDNLEGKGPVLDWQPPSQAIAQWQAALPQQATLTPKQFLQAIQDEVLSASLHIHHPRNLGHQVATPLPMAALCDLVAALTNQAMAVYETGPSATLLERQVLYWLGDLIGWQHTEGVLTSGGAQANLTALLAARQVKAGWNAWQQGVGAGQPLRVLTSEHAHYSVSRAAGIMGLGTDAVIKVAADEQGRMDMIALQLAWQRCLDEGSKPFAVVATAGCTPTGSIDPLPEIANFCSAHDLWMHVDGAHGASILLSRQHRPLLEGIALADSVVWDGHKLLYMPATVSAVLFREPQHGYAAFAQEASYLFQGNSDAEETYNTSYRTLECTKRMMGLKLWAAFSLYGVEKLGGLVEQVFFTARLLSDKLHAATDFELLMPPQTNIVCFRYGAADQSHIRKQLVESGAFHLTQVTLHGKVWLRATLMNTFTTEADLDALLAAIRAHGESSPKDFVNT